MRQDELLKSIVRRIENLDEEIATLNADKSAIYKEAKADGIDLPALRLVVADRRRRSKDPAKYEQTQGIVETYCAALDVGTTIALRAHARPTPAAGESTGNDGHQPRGHGSSKPAAPEPAADEPTREDGCAEVPVMVARSLDEVARALITMGVPLRGKPQ